MSVRNNLSEQTLTLLTVLSINMNFIEITIAKIDGEAVEAVSDVFNRYGYGGAVIETAPPDFKQACVRTVISADNTDLLHKIQIVLALMDKALPHGLPEPQLKHVGEHDWLDTWKENFHVIRIKPHIVIQPSWQTYTPSTDDVVIKLDPGLAFGSGLHPTTALCLRILQGMSLEGIDVLDVGTGSGILSIAARKLGASQGRAVDVDKIAVRVAKENFECNRLMNIETAVGSANENGNRTWSLVVANILSNVLIEIMPDLKRALASHGKLILSGIITAHEQEMKICLREHGLTIAERYVEDDWVAYVTGCAA
ncbi:MAG: ribosomal protein L11 methyltransferase [Anaerolineaceae bacterium 4572_78]|nr:MAG: ribosomal protein L11 methyltransferase [Anaerolineaceae bacterium 4572_78]